MIVTVNLTASVPVTAMARAVSVPAAVRAVPGLGSAPVHVGHIVDAKTMQFAVLKYWPPFFTFTILL